MEPVSAGRAYTHSAAILLNLTSVLELALFNGRHRHTGLDRLISFETGDPARFVSFEGPMEKGRDLVDGGAAINASGATIIGLADVADSLSAIRRVVFEDRAVSFRDLVLALEKDFAGTQGASLKARLADPARTPKYGNEDPAADGMVTWLLALLDGLFGAKVNHRGGRYRVGYWTMTNHAGFGRIMPATPNGRGARENFTSGFTAVSGVTPHLTPALNSAAAQPARFLSSGVALNLKYAPEAGDPEAMLDRFAAPPPREDRPCPPS